MNYKQIPFNIETAKDIVLGRINGRITIKSGYDVKISSFKSYNRYYPISGTIIYHEDSNEVNSWTVNGNFFDNNNDSKLNLVLWIEDKEEHKFKPYDKILVPVYSSVAGGCNIWECRLFSNYINDVIVDTNGILRTADEVLPFEGNEHLVGQPIEDKQQ